MGRKQRIRHCRGGRATALGWFPERRSTGPGERFRGLGSAERTGAPLAAPSGGHTVALRDELAPFLLLPIQRGRILGRHALRDRRGRFRRAGRVAAHPCPWIWCT